MANVLSLGGGIPILGQPCTFKAVSGPQVVIECACEAKTVLLLPGLGIPMMCPACKRGRVLVKVNGDGTTGGMQLEVADVAMEAPK